ncbi:cysteine hydrolase [Halogranum tailed virus 1]|uniref:Cysteine hydrolase n=1 Tax=Halogranum tailed virus 1 TaxID=1273749 RepID=R4TGR5_9CAUD|nr:cysteine hydrolase [Halogranum tailed virus 1]AGM11436.1 cysteine hydrolase [Halogranum tailed virus 1]
MSKAVAVVNMQRGFDTNELIDPVNEVISLAERQEVPIIFTMDDFGEDKYEEPWELSPRLDVQGDEFAGSQEKLDSLIEQFGIEQFIVVGNLSEGQQLVRDGVRVEEATRGELPDGVDISILEL